MMSAPDRFMEMYNGLPRHIRDYVEANTARVLREEVPALAHTASPSEFDLADHCFTYGAANKLKVPLLQGLINWLAAAGELHE